MSFKMKGFNNLSKLLEEMQKVVDEVSGGKFLKFKELFTDEFMKENTSHVSIEQFFEHFGVKTQEEFNDLDKNELDDYTKETTNYDSFHTMAQHAGNLYIKKELEKKGIKTK